MKASIPLWWQTPIVGGNDPIIDQAAHAYIARKHGTYTLGGLLADLRITVPVLRARVEAAKAAERARAHADTVRRSIEPRIAA